MSARHALLIGINSYPLVEHANLRGCVNDVTLMASILEERFGFPAENLRVLRDEEATESNVRRGMDEFEERIGPGDVAVFFYAGHGSRVLVSRSPKSFNESIVPHDSGRGTHPNRDIHDEEIDAWVQRLNAKTPHVTLILDCCHSVVLTRDAFGEDGRGIAADERLTPVFQAAGAAPAVEVGGRQSVVLVAACQGHEQAYEYRVYEGGRVLRHGAMTYFLSRSLSRITGPVTWRQLFSTLQPALNAEYSRQHPQLWGRLDSLVFGTREVRPQAHLRLVEVGKDEVELSGGAAHGVSEGSLWRIHEPHPTNAWATSAGLPELARVRIVSVSAATSTGRLGEPVSTLAAGQWAFLEEHRLPAPVLTVAAGDMAPQDAAKLESFLADSFVLASADDAPAQVRIRRLEPRGEPGPDEPCPALGALSQPTWAAVGHDGRLAARTHPAVSPTSLRDVIFDLERVATYRRLLAIENPDRASRVDGRVELRMLRWSESEGAFVDAACSYSRAVFAEGDRAEFEIRNQHIEEVWVNLLQFGADGAVELLLPRNGHPTYSGGGVRLEPGQVLRVAADYYSQDPRFRRQVAGGLPLYLPSGFPWAAEPGEDLESGMLYLKLMVTLQSVGFEIFELESSRSGALWHPLQKLVQLYWSGRGSRSFSPRGAPDMDWTTVTHAVELRRR